MVGSVHPERLQASFPVPFLAHKVASLYRSRKLFKTAATFSFRGSVVHEP